MAKGVMEDRTPVVPRNAKVAPPPMIPKARTKKKICLVCVMGYVATYLLGSCFCIV